jgi:hypothetical protein
MNYGGKNVFAIQKMTMLHKLKVGTDRILCTNFIAS